MRAQIERRGSHVRARRMAEGERERGGRGRVGGMGGARDGNNSSSYYCSAAGRQTAGTRQSSQAVICLLGNREDSRVPCSTRYIARSFARFSPSISPLPSSPPPVSLCAPLLQPTTSTGSSMRHRGVAALLFHTP